MLSPRTHTPAMFPSPSEQYGVRLLSGKLVLGTSVTIGALASVFGIAAGSVVMYGLIIRAQPNGARPINEVEASKKPGKTYSKPSNKLLVMRATAR